MGEIVGGIVDGHGAQSTQPAQGAQGSLSSQSRNSGGLKAGVVLSLLILPPLIEQERIVERLEALQEKLRALEAAQAQTDETLKRLEQAVLEKAFRGEL